MTPLSKDNCLIRVMRPAPEKVDPGWATFQVIRRKHATLMKVLGVEGKLAADQPGHTLDVNQHVYAQLPAESRLVIVNQPEKRLLI